MENLKIKRIQLIELDTVLLTVTQKLARLELILATVFPEDENDIASWEEIVNRYSDDIGDDPDYHGYSEEDLQYVVNQVKK